MVYVYELLGHERHIIDSLLNKSDARLIADSLVLSEMNSKVIKLLTEDLTDGDRKLICESLGHEKI